MIDINKVPKTDSEWVLFGKPVIVEKGTQSDVFYWKYNPIYEVSTIDILPTVYFLKNATYQGQG
jgi:hypothetical protein